jgi:hypothetical protein
MRVIPNKEFVWQGLDLHLGRRKEPVLVLIADKTYPHLYCIKYPDGTPANLARAKDAAYGHARYLLAQQRPVDASYSPEEPSLVGEIA